MSAQEDRPAFLADNARHAFESGRYTRAETVEAIRSVLNVTTRGAEEMLDHPLMPSVRYAAVARFEVTQ